MLKLVVGQFFIYARRLQVQERLTVQIANALKRILKTEDVAVVVDAKHMWMSSRGIKDESVFDCNSRLWRNIQAERQKRRVSKLSIAPKVAFQLAVS